MGQKKQKPEVSHIAVIYIDDGENADWMELVTDAPYADGQGRASRTASVDAMPARITKGLREYGAEVIRPSADAVDPDRELAPLQ